MTFRARPVVKRAQKPSWESRDRKNFYLNIGFGLVVVAALAILGIAVALTYYNDHLVAVGSVGGKAISKDELRDRVLIETWRLEQAQNQIRTQAAAGYLSETQSQQQLQLVQQQRGQVVPISLERIIDNRIQADLATTGGVSVTDQDIDDRLLEEATTPEDPPRLGHRGRARDLGRRHRADRGPDPGRAHQDRHRAQGPAGGQGLGRDRQDGLDGHLHRGPGRRPRLAQGRGRPARPPVRGGPVRRGAGHPDRRHRGRGRHLPDRPGDRDRRRVGRWRVSRQPRQRWHRPDQVPRGHPWRCHPRSSSRTRPSPRPQARPAAHGRRDLPLRRHGRAPRGSGQGPAHPVLAQGRPERRPGRRDPRHRPVVGRRQGGRRCGVREGHRRSDPVRHDRPRRERRAERPWRDRLRGRAVGLRERRQQLRRVVLQADPRREAHGRPDPAADQDRVRVPHRPGPQPRPGPGRDQDPGRRRQRLRQPWPATCPRVRRPARAAISAGSPRASWTSGSSRPSSTRRSARRRRSSPSRTTASTSSR